MDAWFSMDLTSNKGTGSVLTLIGRVCKSTKSNPITDWITDAMPVMRTN